MGNHGPRSDTAYDLGHPALVVAFCKHGEPDYVVLGQRVFLAGGATPEQVMAVTETALFTSGARAYHELLHARSEVDLERMVRIQGHAIRAAQFVYETAMTGPILKGIAGVATFGGGVGFGANFGDDALRAGTGATRKVELFEVGEYRTLANMSKGDDIVIHHVPQAHPASQVIPGYDYNTAPAIALPKKLHSHIPTLKGEYSGTPHELLSIGIDDLGKFRQIPDSRIIQLIKINRQKYPRVLGK